MLSGTPSAKDASRHEYGISKRTLISFARLRLGQHQSLDCFHDLRGLGLSYQMALWRALFRVVVPGIASVGLKPDATGCPIATSTSPPTV